VGDRVLVRETGRSGTVDQLKGVYARRIRVRLDPPVRAVRGAIRPQRQAWYGPEELEPAE
jgi:hypothetical protein